MLTNRPPFYIPIPDSVFNKLNPGKVNSYTFQLLGPPDFGGFYGSRLEGVEIAADDGQLEPGPSLEFFSTHICEAAIPYTAFILCWSAYRGRKHYLKHLANAQRNYVSNSVILKQLLHIKDPDQITDSVAYNRELRENIAAYNVIVAKLVKKNLAGRYKTFQLSCPPPPPTNQLVSEALIAKDAVQFEVLPGAEENIIEEVTLDMLTEKTTVVKTSRPRRDNFIVRSVARLESSVVFRKILTPAWISLILAAFTFWIESITIATFVGSMTYLMPILLVIPAVPALFFLGIYHLQNTHFKKTNEQVEQENLAMLDRDMIVADANRIFELEQLRKEQRRLQEATHNSVPAPQISPRTNFDGFNYGANANARSAAVCFTKAVLIFGLAHYISFYFLECVKVATSVFLPAIPVVNLIGFYGFVAFSVVCGIATMFTHHAMLTKNDNPRAKERDLKKYTMDELKQMNIDRGVQFSKLANNIIKSTKELNQAGQTQIDLPPCVLKYQQAPPFEPDSILEDIYYFFTENMMGIFCGRALGILGTALFMGYTISTFGAGIFALVLAGGIIYAGLQMYEKRQSQMREIIAEIQTKEDSIECAQIAEHNLKMEAEQRKGLVTAGLPSSIAEDSVRSNSETPIITNVSESIAPSDNSPTSDETPSPKSPVTGAVPKKRQLHIQTRSEEGQIVYSPLLMSSQTGQRRQRSNSQDTSIQNEHGSPLKRQRTKSK